jgi:hypothetical protein
MAIYLVLLNAKGNCDPQVEDESQQDDKKNKEGEK